MNSYGSNAEKWVRSSEYLVFEHPITPAALEDGKVIIRIVKRQGPIAICGFFAIKSDHTSGGGPQNAYIGEVNLSFSIKSYKNLVSRNAFIEYTIPEKQRIDLSIFDVSGRKIITLVKEEKEPGIYRVKWDLKAHNGKVGKGVYFIVLSGEKEKKTQKIIVIK